MSRIGKQPISIPNGVKVEIQGTRIKVSGNRGMLERDIRPEIDIKEQEKSQAEKSSKSPSSGKISGPPVVKS